jgi:catechol 2,3-dioxygenase-like lactoylglutathione lyase family enzyme
MQRHTVRTAIICAVALLALTSRPSATGNEAALAPADAVGPIGITVSDMDASLRFYTTVLSFTKVADVEVTGGSYERLTGVFGTRMRVARLTLGTEAIELTEFKAPRGRPYPVDTRANDRWFQHIAIIVPDMERAYAHLVAHGVRHASTGPVRLPDWNPGAGGIEAFYFRDPDGHFLEILEFPAGKGDPKWPALAAAVPSRLFLGIDHTAIVTGDTERALAFYRDTLGLTLAGAGTNYGVEQEHLNNVFGVRLRITTLKAPTGPGVELLDYLAPGDGRPAPIDLKANDLAHWHTTVVTRDVGAALELAPRRVFTLVSPDVAVLPEGTLGFLRGLLVRDPDGHGVRLVER